MVNTAQRPESLGVAFSAWLDAQDAVPADGKNIPDDGVCVGCDRLKRDHPGVERVLAIRKLKYFNPETGAVVIRAGIPYCRCKESKPAPVGGWVATGGERSK